MKPIGRNACAAERGSGAVLAVAVIGATVSLTAGTLAVGGAVVAQRRASAAADLAVLAAADTAVGRVPGDPCAIVGAVAEANGARTESCDVEGVVVTVTVSVGYLGVPARASARAGPPGSP
ncbi:Rv3654c family TadE-like protein [Leifsonia sp. NPDC080035]|uniref:Rv3654c family TadE-like protein n=1 Tax=Leifsonia sp. NPDC080035 TaxID=3143936 RepID=A0AAU7G8C0_9MICO